MQKILVTGGAGFIGSAVIRMAIKKGYKVLNFDALTYASTLESVSSVENSDRYEFLRADLRNQEVVEKTFRQFQPDKVLHLAAETHVDKSILRPNEFLETNIIGTFNLLETAKNYWFENGKSEIFRFHHISTDEVFGSLGKDGFFTEDTPYKPQNPYSASKASSDHLVRAWSHTYGLPILISNCSNNYGPYQYPEKLIPLMIINALNGKRMPVYGDGRNIRDWLYVEDHADAILSILKDGQPGRSYNIGCNNEISNIDLVRKICGVLDQIKPREISYDRLINLVADRPGHDFRYAINSNRITSELNWKPRFSFEEGLVKTIKWYVNNKDWWKPLLKKIDG
tara:strand:+ start:1727 stop:2746 length:1020 start_codon:yes stop_codon:yes gene_type:complete